MNEIIELAGKLGKAIASSPQATAMRAARKALDAEASVVQTLKDYQAQEDKIAQLQHDNKPIEVDDKHKLQDLHDKLIASDVFKKFTAAQVDYVDLLRQVNSAMRQQLAETEAE
ncbi:MAG: YlbF family regulator [Phycisphaerae bacterium]